jgi:hypothetical protein
MTQTTVARVPINKRPPLVSLKPNLDIDQRIAAAFGNKVASAEVANLITDVEMALIEAGEASHLARSQAMWPALPVDEVAIARKLMEDAQFRQSRLEIAIVKLRERVAWLKSQEQDAERRVAYDKVKEERDQLAEELADTYPELASKLAELLHRVVANDAEIAGLKLPTGRVRPLGAELTARGLQHFQAGMSPTPSIVRDTHLPSFTIDDPKAPSFYLWPIRRTVFD